MRTRFSLYTLLVKGGVRGTYTETVFAKELVKYGLSEWNQLLSIAEKQRGKYGQELKVALESLIEKAHNTKRSQTDPSRPSSSSIHQRRPRMKDSIGNLLPYGSSLINNSLPQGVEPVQHQCILEPEHGIFYLDAQNRMCFQRIVEIPNAPTSHLVDLREACLSHKHVELGYHALISVALAERLPELRQDYIWVKLEIEEEAEVLRNLQL